MNGAAAAWTCDGFQSGSSDRRLEGEQREHAMTSNTLAPETIAVQAGDAGDEATGAIVPPVHLATTFVRDPDNQYRKGFSYGRPDNATVRQVERVVAQLEGGAGALVVASGMTAATMAFLALERPAHVVAPNVMYWGLRDWISRDAPSFGIEPTFVDAADPAAIAAAIRPGRTKLVWIETPANPLWTITDIAATAKIAHEAGALLAVEFDRVDAGAHATHCPWRRPRHAFGDQIPQRAFRRDRRRPGVCSPGWRIRAGQSPAQHAGRHPGALRGGVAAARACAPCMFACATSAPRPWPSPATSMDIHGSKAVLYPGLPSHPGHAVAQRQMQDGFARDAVGARQGWRGGGGGRGGQRAGVEAGNLPWGRREFARASRQY